MQPALCKVEQSNSRLVRGALPELLQAYSSSCGLPEIYEQSKSRFMRGALPMLLQACTGSSGLPVRWRSARRRAAGNSACARAGRPSVGGRRTTGAGRGEFTEASCQAVGGLVHGGKQVVRAGACTNTPEQMQVGGARWAIRWRGRKQTAGPRRASSSPNPSIERTCPGKPGHAAHVER
jgi:hypothetical protein